MDVIWLNLGCGANHLPSPWRNHDMDMDIRMPLPFKDSSVSRINIEHTLEHGTPKEAWNFLVEAHRVLERHGVIRIAIPDVSRMWRKMTAEYAEVVKNGGFGDGTPSSCIKAAIFCHGHQSVWTAGMLCIVLTAIEFRTKICEYGHSLHPELCGVEGHGKVVGESIARVETSVVEGTKV